MIHHIQQPTPDSCTSACLAMLTELPVDQVVNEFHAEWKARKTDPALYLSEKGAKFTLNANPFCHTVDWGGVYLLTVPSLNIEGGLHHIVLDLTEDVERVLDPNEGRPDKKFYTGWSPMSESPLSVRLSAWLVDLKYEGRP